MAGAKNLAKYRRIYEELIACGMFYETYPTLTGDWTLDHQRFIHMINNEKKEHNGKLRKK